MCGLVGIAGDTSVALKDAFKGMLLVNQLRGSDSTGVFTVRGEDVHVAKTLGVPEYLYDTKSFDTAMTGTPKIMAGHGRSKTVGENSRQPLQVPVALPQISAIMPTGSTPLAMQ